MAFTRDQRSMNDAIATIIESDPELRDEIRLLVQATIKHAKHTLRYGSQADKSTLMRAIVPTMMKALEHNEQGEGERARQAAWDRMKEAMLEGADSAAPATD